MPATLPQLITHYLQDDNSLRQAFEGMLPKLPEDFDRFNPEPIVTGSRRSRTMLRLAANSAIELLKTSSDQQITTDFRRTLQSIKPINSRARASAATDKLLMLCGWAIEEYGDHSDRRFSGAATITDHLLSHYNGWEFTHRFDEIADYYTMVVSPLDNNHTLVTGLIEALDAVKEN